MTGDALAARRRLAARLGEAVAGLGTSPSRPTYVVDLGALDANAADLARRTGGTPIRVATKSLPGPALIDGALDAPGCLRKADEAVETVPASRGTGNAW